MGILSPWRGRVWRRGDSPASVASVPNLISVARILLTPVFIVVALTNPEPGLARTVAAVLFAVNVTAVVPATPSNIGVFQLAVISVLHTGFGISTADALAYGVILQAVEVATAVMLGLPALVREGLTWGDLRMQALSGAPVRLQPKPPARDSGREPVSL